MYSSDIGTGRMVRPLINRLMPSMLCFDLITNNTMVKLGNRNFNPLKTKTRRTLKAILKGYVSDIFTIRT
jgi:hypothetical protein